MNHNVITPEQFAEYERLKRLQLLGYVRKEVLDLCRHTENTSSLTVVPVAPKSGNWVPIFFEGESE